MQQALAAARRASSGRRSIRHRGRRREEHGRRHPCRIRRSAGDAAAAALQMQVELRAARVDRWRGTERALRPACRRHQAPGQRLLRRRGQPRRARDERGARRAGAAVARGRVDGERRLPGGACAARPGSRCGCATSPAPSTSSSCCIRGCGRTSRRCARSRPRRTTCRSSSTPSSAASASGRGQGVAGVDTRLADAARHGRDRQDAPVAAGGARTCWTTTRTASGSSSWRRCPTRSWCRRRWPRCWA